MKHFTSPIKLLLVAIFVFANYGFSQGKKPNVIIIMTDDMGNNIEALGNPWLKTPNMNKLKSESVYLSNFHQALMYAISSWNNDRALCIKNWCMENQCWKK